MRRWLLPRSARFRAGLGMALLAWAVLATGALAGPLHGLKPMGVAAATAMTPTQAAASHCDGMPVQPAVPDRAPAMPMGHGDCCHGGCVCLTACNAVLTVPRWVVAMSLPDAGTQNVASVELAQPSPAPPFRPPIA